MQTVKQTAKEFAYEFKLLKRYFEQGLYYFYCQPLMKKGEFVECRPRWYRTCCLRCLLKAAKELYIYRYAPHFLRGK